MSEDKKKQVDLSASEAAAAEKDTDTSAATSPATSPAAESAAENASNAPRDTRSLRRAERAAKKAKRAQDKADRARAEALDAVRASGLGIVADDDGDAGERDDNDDRLDPADIDGDSGADGRADDSDDGGDTTVAATADADAGADGDADSGSAAPATTPEKNPGEKGTAKAKGAAASSTPGGKGAKAKGNAKAAGAAATRGSRTTRRREGNATLATILLVVAALLTIGGIVGWVAYSGQSSAATAEQHETDAPQEAADSARQIVTQMFTYDYDKVDDQLGQVEGRLTGDAEKEFRETTRPKVSELAKSVQANSYATVAAVGITEHPDQDHVGTVMMLNRMVSTKDQPEAQNSATRLKVSMERVPGADGAEAEWKVAKVEVL